MPPTVPAVPMIQLPEIRQASQLEMLAMRRAIPEGVDKIAAKSLTAGEHKVDVTVRIMGTIKKGQPYEQTCPIAVPWQTLFGAALSRLNKATGKSIKELAEGLMIETDEGLKRDPEAIEKANEEIKPHVERLCERLIESTRRPVDGRITTRLNLIVLSPDGHATTVIDAPGVLKNVPEVVG